MASSFSTPFLSYSHKQEPNAQHRKLAEIPEQEGDRRRSWPARCSPSATCCTCTATPAPPTTASSAWASTPGRRATRWRCWCGWTSATSRPSSTCRLVAAEANSVLDCLRWPEPVVPAIPLISALCQDGDVDPRFFAFHQDLVVRGVADILDGVGSLIFDDHLNKMLRRYQTGLVGNPPELMATYSCLPVAVPEDCRSMFITFSRGAPIDREEIFEYFRQKWGDCVVRVLMEKTSGGSQAMYGRIIFRSEAFVQLVLNGERLVKITIRHRQIWLRKYVPRPAATHNQN
uniref:RRM domain-containing protein n=1 Tax=Oryza brachyantha TaxID=4533 RepID=J3N1C3_ORYBR